MFEGTDRESGLRVAIKLLLGGEDRVRFAGEADLLERLDHPNIVKYIRHGENRDGVPYLAMEWLEGETLARRLDRGPLSVLEAVTIGAQLAAALDYVHREGVIHRDLKPSNIYLVGGDLAHAKLIDLGIAKSGLQDLTESGQILGTPGYMAPEQARGDKDADARIDLFALGCVLYESLAGRPPFEGTAVMEVLARLLLETPTAIEHLVPGVPPRLGHLIAELLEKDPDHRVADAGLAFEELDGGRRAIIGGDRQSLVRLPPVVESDAAPTVRAKPAARPVNRWWWVWKILLPSIGGAALLLATLVWLVNVQRSKCNDTRRQGCPDRCAGGDAKACELAAEGQREGLFKLRQDRTVAVASYLRGCELREPGVCARGVRALDEMLAAEELPRSALLPAIDTMLAIGCELDDKQACFQLALRHTPGVGSLAPDPVRAYEHAIKACVGDLDTACNHLTSMLDAGLGDGTQRKRAQATRDDACKRGVMLCAKGSLVVTSSWAAEAILDDDPATRATLPHLYAIVPGPHKVSYLRGTARCDLEVHVAPGSETRPGPDACKAPPAQQPAAAPRSVPTPARKAQAARTAGGAIGIETKSDPFHGDRPGMGASRAPDLLAKLKSAYLAGIEGCYRNHLAQHPAARGTVTLHLKVSSTGTMSSGQAYGFERRRGVHHGAYPSWRFPITETLSGRPAAAAFFFTLSLTPT